MKHTLSLRAGPLTGAAIALLLLLCLLTGCVQTYDGPVVQERVLVQMATDYIPFPDWEPIRSRDEYAYDIYGNLARVMEYEDGELNTEHRYRYDEAGNQTQAATISHSALIPHTVQRTESTYDAQKRLLTRTQRDFWGREQWQYSFEYDDETHTTTTTYRQNGEETVYHDQTILDAEGRVQETISSSGHETRYFYDAAGNESRLEYWQEGVLKSYSEMTYDAQGRLTLTTSYDADGSLQSQTSREYQTGEYSWIVTIRQKDGSARVEGYNASGTLDYVQSLDESGRLYMEQRYFYDHIDVPKEE